MSREYLFKAKRVDWKELPKEHWWVEGDLIHEPSGTAIQYSIDANNKKRRTVLVDPETVCEYTTSPDRNGRRIFERDIVKTNQYGVDKGYGHNYAGFDMFLIEFSEGGFCLKNKWRRFNFRPSGNFEVVGNIFDNPELLKEIA